MKEIQQLDNANKTKLTAVTIGHGTSKLQFFIELRHDERGMAILPFSMLNTKLDKLVVRTGDTFTAA